MQEERTQQKNREKAAPYRTLIGEDDLVITADTVVIVGDEVLGKPKDAEDARRMLQLIIWVSGN